MSLKVEFGDFQTPQHLAEAVARLLADTGTPWRGLMEPSAGIGNLLLPTIKALPGIEQSIALEINPDYVQRLRDRIQEPDFRSRNVLVQEGDAFSIEWETYLNQLPDPLLVLTNPPWVTSAAQTRIGGTNVPLKANTYGRDGLEAVTGKSNFDVSEWILRQLTSPVARRGGALAALCKTSVARRILDLVWKERLPTSTARMYRIDALQDFGASVDACFFYLNFSTIQERNSSDCEVFQSLQSPGPTSTIGLRGDLLVADIARFGQTSHLRGSGGPRWRSGVKHDCAKVMEFRLEPNGLVNGFGEIVDVEPTFVYPMLKSSDLANTDRVPGERFMLLPQRSTSEDTNAIRASAPKTWDYLERHSSLLDGRASSIYKRRARFAVFGVGPYTFMPWKVAVSGLYKHLTFRLIGPFSDQPVVFDDTCYMLGLESEVAANAAFQVLNSPSVLDFYSSLIFWDSKRPITADLLNQLDLVKAASACGLSDALRASLTGNSLLHTAPHQTSMF